MGNAVGSFPTKTPIQSNKQLTDAEGDGGVSRNDDGLVSTFRVSAIIDLKLQRERKLMRVVTFPQVSHSNTVFVCVYPHGGPSHPSMDRQRALTCGANALHNDTKNAASALS